MIAEICRSLDGIPLAIELAAARTQALTSEQILQRLDDRYSLLRGGGLRRIERQQTLRAAIDWSYELLDGAERTVLQRASLERASEHRGRAPGHVLEQGGTGRAHADQVVATVLGGAEDHVHVGGHDEADRLVEAFAR